MDYDFSRHGSSSDGDFGFAFNDNNFSDRLLRIEIMGGISDSRYDGEGCTSIADWARHRKRRREDIKKESGVTISDCVACPEEQILVKLSCTDKNLDMRTVMVRLINSIRDLKKEKSKDRRRALRGVVSS